MPTDLNAVHETEEAEVQPEVLRWNEDDQAKDNYRNLGERLAETGDLFRHADHSIGLLRVLDDGEHRDITTAKALAPVIVDRIPVEVIKDGKIKGSRIANAHLDAMLQADVFLQRFRRVDTITGLPHFLPDFSLTRHGLNDGGEGHRIYYTGESPTVSNSMETINAFLGVMDFATNADRTNAVAAALTVLLRNHWSGGKPILTVTATKSHAGKDTIIAFAANEARSTSISYQATNWAFERAFVGALNTNPDTAVLVVENARLDRKDRFIASAYLERFATDPHPFLFSTGTGEPVRRLNNIVTAISTNFGTVSEDIANRSLPIHLNPTGNVAERRSNIGNPKLEFLPANKHRIAAELRGMVDRWKKAGKPLDENVRHPFTPWAKTVGGILQVNGFTDFLANYHHRKTANDPLREGLVIVGRERRGEWLPATEWAMVVEQLGLVKSVIPAGDRENETAKTRGIGVVLSAHRDETFDTETDTQKLRLKLERSRVRWSKGSQPQTRYRFKVLSEEVIPADDVVAKPKAA
jgi:hypothetical protein